MVGSFLMILVTVMLTILSTLAIEKIAHRYNIISSDIHKIGRDRIPSVGGLGFSLGLITALVIVGLLEAGLGSGFPRHLAVLIAIILVSSVIGLYDDLKVLSGRVKVVLTLIPGAILVASGFYLPVLFIPFMGTVNAYIVYPLVLPIVFAVAMNAVNMIDTHNGTAPLITTVLLLTILFGSILYRNEVVPEYPVLIKALAATLAALVAYLPFNFYPSRVFNGDVGSLTWGALLAFFAVSLKTELLLVLAAMPVITNGFTIITSIRGFKERRKIRKRPVLIVPAKNLIIANPDRDAPLTLASLAASTRPLKEDELVCTLLVLVSISSAVALIIWRFLILA